MQVDLWQGEIERFVSDRQILLGGSLPPTEAVLREALKDAVKDSLRHVTVSPPGDSAESVLQVVHDFLTEVPVNHSLKRVTFVLPSLDLYMVFQTCLFSMFPDLV